jgi:hypothetical protein
MKPTLAGLILATVFSPLLFAQQGRPDHRPGGFPGFGDPSRRTEMMADRLAEDIGLSRDQRNAMKDLLDRAQDSARPLQEELQSIRTDIKSAIRAGKGPETLTPLHEKLGTNHVKLAAIQSAAFADALKTLNESQKNDADIVYDVLGFVASTSGRGPIMPRGGPGGPEGFGAPGRHPPTDPGHGVPQPKGDRGSRSDGRESPP